MTSTISTWLRQGADALGLSVDFEYKVAIEGRALVRAVARIQSFGGANGMLVFSHYDDVRSSATELVRAGFGYTVLDERRPDEVFDLESYKEMLLDWGWTGPNSSRPPWMPSPQ
jgi:hypothetical protein